MVGLMPRYAKHGRTDARVCEAMVGLMPPEAMVGLMSPEAMVGLMSPEAMVGLMPPEQ